MSNSKPWGSSGVSFAEVIKRRMKEEASSTPLNGNPTESPPLTGKSFPSLRTNTTAAIPSPSSQVASEPTSIPSPIRPPSQPSSSSSFTSSLDVSAQFKPTPINSPAASPSVSKSSDGATAASPTKEPVAILFPSRTNLAAEIVAPYAIGVGRVSAEMTNVPTVGVASDFANGQRTEEREKPRVPSFEVLVVSEEKAVSIDLVSPLENAPAAPMERRPSVPIPTSVSLPPSAPIMAPLPLRPAWTGSLPLSIVGDRHSQTAFAHKLMEPPKLLHPSPLSVAQTNGSARPFVYKQESGSFRENRGEYGNWGKYGVEPSRRNGFFPRSEPAPSSFGHHSSGGYNSRSNGGHGQTTNPYSRFREEEEVYTDHYVQSQNNDPSNYLSTGYDFEYGSHVASPQEHHFAQYTQPAPAPHYPPVSGQYYQPTAEINTRNGTLLVNPLVYPMYIVNGGSDGSGPMKNGGYVDTVSPPNVISPGPVAATSVLKSFYFPSELTGFILGKLGMAVKELRQRYNCEIWIDDPDETRRPGYAMLHMHGNEENVDMVAERIRQRLEYRGGELHPLAGVQSMDALRPYIPKLELAYGVALHAFVCHVEGNGVIFLQLPSHPSFLKLYNLENKLSRHAMMDGNWWPFIDTRLTPLTKGCFVAAPSIAHSPLLGSVDNPPRWLRAVVICEVDDNGFIGLRSLDYGFTFSSNSNILKLLPAEFCLAPLQAIECRVVHGKFQEERPVEEQVSRSDNVILHRQWVRVRLVGNLIDNQMDVEEGAEAAAVPVVEMWIPPSISTSSHNHHPSQHRNSLII